MTVRVVSIRKENPQEKRIREWFEAQAADSAKSIEDAARLLIGLISGLLGVLFGVLTVQAETLPAYLSQPLVRTCGIAAVVLWLLSLLSALAVVVPRQWLSQPGRPDLQAKLFWQIPREKSAGLTLAVTFFGLAVIALAVVLVAALSAAGASPP